MSYKLPLLVLALLPLVSATTLAQVQNNAVCESGQPNILTNGSFEQTSNPNYDTSFEMIESIGRPNSGSFFIDRHTDDEFPGWFSTGGIALQQGGFSQGGTLELGTNGFLNIPSAEGRVFAEMDGNNHNQIVAVIPGQTMTWEMWHHGRRGMDTVSLSLGAPNAVELQSVVASHSAGWSTHRGTYTVPAGMTELQLTITPVSASDGDIDSSHFLDNVKLCYTQPVDGNIPKVSNLALNGTATQSSTAHGGKAARAIDGNTSGVWRQGSVTHTEKSTQPLWQVELATAGMIEEIILFNRTDNCCVNRLSNYTVSVLNDNGDTVFSQIFSATPTPTNTIDVSGVVGRTVRVQQNGNEPLSLAEVQVLGF